MLNIDMKILSKALTTRLLRHMPTLIHTDQNGFIPKRNTLGTPRRLAHTYHHPLLEEDAFALVFLDIKQAFDSVSWEYLKR